MNILNSIKKTIKYGEKYGGKLTKNQLFIRLIGNTIYSEDEINKIIEKNDAVKKKIVSEKKNTRKENKIKKAKILSSRISKKFKDVLFIGITGSTAADYPKKNDDIDIMIITKNNKLWVTRFRIKIFIILNKIPHRKFGKKENKDDFCFNLWLDEKSIGLKKEKQNLKNAIDILLIKPLFNKNNIYEKFLLSNTWVKRYTATGYNEKTKKITNVVLKEIRDIYLWKLINLIIFFVQFLYMKKRIKNETVGIHEAFFHRDMVK